MKVKSLKNIALSFLLVSVLACSTEPLNSPSGYVNIGINFPQKGFSIKAIPDATEKIDIIIKGTGLTEDIKRSITKDESSKSIVIEKLPTGDKEIIVSASDKDNKVLAKASANINIEAGKINKVEITLKELVRDLKVNLDNYPANGSKSFVEIKAEDKTIFKEFEGKSIVFEKFDFQGDIEIKAGVFDEDSTPISSIKTKVSVKDVDIVKVKLNPIIFNLEEEFDLNESLTFSLGAFSGIVDNFIFKDENNKSPKIDKVTFKLNGKEIPTPTDRNKPICVSLTDNIEVNVEASDPDNDKLSFFWANTRTTDAGGYRSRLLKERSSSITLSERLRGNHSLGFIVTDRKTFVGPRTFYFQAKVLCNN